jgi:hypothetical protein
MLMMTRPAHNIPTSSPGCCSSVIATSLVLAGDFAQATALQRGHVTCYHLRFLVLYHLGVLADRKLFINMIYNIFYSIQKLCL